MSWAVSVSSHFCSYVVFRVFNYKLTLILCYSELYVCIQIHFCQIQMAESGIRNPHSEEDA